MNVRNSWQQRCSELEEELNSLQRELEERYKSLKKEKLVHDNLDKQLAEALLAKNKLEEDQMLFMDWARQQEWELPPNIRERLPRDQSFLLKAALEKVPYGKSPAEYALNILYFLSLSEEEQMEAASKVFHRERDERPEDFAKLENVIEELHEFLFLFPDAKVKMEAAYGYLSRCVPKFSTNPRSDWVVLKKRAVTLYPVYSRVTVRRLLPTRGYTHANLRSTKKGFSARLFLEIDQINKGQHRPCKIKTIFNNDTQRFELEGNGIHNWEIANYGMADYRGEFQVTNLKMDNNPPYRDGMKGIVQIEWTGKCIYDSAED